MGVDSREIHAAMLIFSMHQLFDPAGPELGIYPVDDVFMPVPKALNAGMFTVVVFAVGKDQKQSKCSSMTELIKQQLPTVEFSAEAEKRGGALLAA